MNLQAEIIPFLESKELSANSRSSYLYDLQQMAAFFEARDLNKNSLELFFKSLSPLALSAQKRKISSSNQFLHYLYEKEILTDFYQLPKLDTTQLAGKKSVEAELMDLSSYYGPVSSTGQFIATLVLETGLTPTEILDLHWADFNWRFNLLTIKKVGLKRVIPLQNKFAVRVKGIQNADELFSKTRQYLYTELKKFTHLTARELREQYILRKVKEGNSIYEVAELLGIKTTSTLEKYFKK